MGFGNWIKGLFAKKTTNAAASDSLRKESNPLTGTGTPASSGDSSESSPAAAATMQTLPLESAEEVAEKIMILIPYIKQYRSQGMLDEEIEAFLVGHEWPAYIVKKAIKNA